MVPDPTVFYTMLGKWQLLIFLCQQTILNLQNSESSNCS